MAYLFGDANNASAGKMSGFMAMNRCPSLAEAIEIIEAGADPADVGADGVEVATNGGFDSDVSGWDVSSPVTIVWDDGQAVVNRNNGTLSKLPSQAGIVPGARYRVRINITAMSDALSFYLGTPGLDTETAFDTLGAKEFFAVAGPGGRFYFGPTGDAAATCAVEDISVVRAGITANLPPSSLQLSPGLWLDESGNKGHVLIPDGMRVNNSTHKIIEIPATLEWNDDDSPQPLVADQNILPADAFLMHVIADVEGTPVDGNLGDGAVADKFCTAAQNANLETGPNNLAIKSPVNDGTNRKMVWTPTENFTGKIHFTVYYVVPRSS